MDPDRENYDDHLPGPWWLRNPDTLVLLAVFLLPPLFGMGVGVWLLLVG